MAPAGKTIRLGRIVGVHGVRGWVKLHSDCRPREAILDYQNFTGQKSGQTPFTLTLTEGREQGKGIAAKFQGIDDRDKAAALIGTVLSVSRGDMPEPEDGEIYWADLIGLTVVNRQGETLGKIREIFETGANDVLCVKDGATEHLIPFAIGTYIDELDWDSETLFVDWEKAWTEDKGTQEQP